MLQDGVLHIPQPEGEALCLPPVDVVLGAAIVYDEEHGAILPAALARIVRRGGCVHLANHTEHAGHSAFLAGMSEAGFVETRSTMIEVDAADGQQYSPVRLHSYELPA